MKKTIDVLYYIFGVIFNISFTIILITLIFMITLNAFDYGKRLLVEDVSSKPDSEVVVNIEDGKDTLAVGEILEAKGLIDNKWIFYLQARLNGSYKYFLSGVFTLNTNMGSAVIMDELQKVQLPPPGAEVKVTIIEGLTNKQIGQYLESEGLFTAEEFEEACNKDYDYAFLKNVPVRANKLEGYLFPDTYNLPPNPKPEDLIIRMLDRFEQIYNSINLSTLSGLNLTTDDIVIMASIIEKEIQQKDERTLASAVIYNRLEKNMKLEMCSTVLYVLDKRKDRLLIADLQIDSPYNTYKVSGLPVGPICNPGAAALEAALNPAEVDYLYFVLKDDESGEHVFTADYGEFTDAKALYNQIY